MHASWMKGAVILLVSALVLTSFPSPCFAISGDDSTDGAAISLGIFAAVIVVLGILGLRSDLENIFTDNEARMDDQTLAALDEDLSRMLRPASEDSQTPMKIGLQMEF